jgi:hypothetical protein
MGQWCLSLGFEADGDLIEDRTRYELVFGGLEDCTNPGEQFL